MSEAFQCISCNVSLYGQRYIQKNKEQHCISCYDRLFAKTCHECKQLIPHNSTELVCEDRHYHEDCARCLRCHCALADQAFVSQGAALLCAPCYSNEFSSQCQACNLPIKPGMRRLEFEGGAWHDTCFVCHGCERPIGSWGFVPDGEQRYCMACYKSTLMPRCRHCKEVLAEEGVVYQDDLWHRKCFLCTACQAPLADESFTSHHEHPYCFPCFSSLYGNKCAACSMPITGQDGGRYISFEDRQWHRSCFTCSRCTASLAGVKFYATQGLTLCLDCTTSS